jgi:peptidoglycan/xylan/chitin deacetylase (PgdA/CDA1 family)
MQRLPVLMYHNVCEDDSKSRGLTISVNKLEEQFRYLSSKGYKAYHLSELVGMDSLPQKGVVITFDDVTQNQLLALPLLKKYDLKATFFIPFSYIGKTDSWNSPGTEKIMTAEQLAALDPAIIELAHHSYLHRRYAELSTEEINKDFGESYKVISETGLQVYPAVAYPYGNYPKQEPAKSRFKKALQSNGMKMGFRIGNRINNFPFDDNYEINRIDVKGHESLFKFRLKLKFGKLF